MTTFRDRLVATLRAIGPVLETPGVLVAGSQPQDVDILVPLAARPGVKARLDEITLLEPSADEPSVWVPRAGDPLRIEVNFIGADPEIVDPMDTYEAPDERLPLMVFGPLSLLTEGPPITVDELRVPVPRKAGAVLEKLVTDRSGEKGDRDLLVVIGLVSLMAPGELAELEHAYRALPPELCHAVRTNLAILSLLPGRPGMPDPHPQRAAIAELLGRLEAA